MNNNLKYNIVVVFIGLVSNFAFTYIVLLFDIPFLFMDSIGTILSAVVLGPVYGAIVGILSNLILSFFLSHQHLYFAIINALIGLIVGFSAYKFRFNIISALVIGIVIGIIATLIGTPISIVLSNGFTGGTVDSFITSLIEKGVNIVKASFIARVLANIIDKVLSCLIVYIAVNKIIFFQKYILTANNEKREE
ncbi:ECF transporter S component [uncultured Brachyspira sp.]|uniref:ECF transporter S component n=1 Tax=uncultured Brachyspira sp. TaxID=221953 RepID=UPI0026287CB0|nr:ECF transporter S component [uncultured Brachyspira sp.]